MTYSEVFEGFKTLTPAEQRRLVEAGTQFIHFNNTALSPGAKVQFKSKSGAFIPGTVVRMNRKNAEVLSKFGKFGIKVGQAVNWRVPAELLIPIPADKVGLYEFP